MSAPLLEKLQASRLYRVTGRRLFASCFRVHPAAAAYLPGLAQLFPPATTAVLRQRLGGGAVTFRHLAHGTDVSPDYQGWWIFALVVRHRWRGLGVGTALVRAALAEIGRRDGDEVRIKVSTEAAPALGLYRRLGFTPVPASSRTDGGGNERPGMIILARSLEPAGGG